MPYTLSSKDIQNFINTDEILTQSMMGVFSVNNLPKKIIKPSCLIINSDPSFLPGSHWVAIYFPSNSPAEFFDSLGKGPFHYSHLMLNFIIDWSSKGFAYNYEPIQPQYSSTCGIYCLYFLYNRVRGRSFEDILKDFSKNVSYNDNLVINFFRRRK